jgi:hypothetical protein
MNHCGLGKAAQGDENNGPSVVKPGGGFETRRYGSAYFHSKDVVFFGFAQNHCGLGKAAQGDENNGSSVVKPGGGLKPATTAVPIFMPMTLIQSLKEAERWIV